ncbi:DUF2795 domain-containing protein [Streptomonospora litoralis]|uniref:DUF2795 domain-containing protein n=1 Tax=Streptomonospora litoralis TaxID=2498135 RepID=A0A4P6Q473_9ACTN|nr:DUF2795 domain-containing protein [Streptomonospora litoralis]QBI53517.1 hypothetical protein EKD16_08615 [Streptomonospora litoralis]
MAQPTFIEVQKALAGADYPSSRDELVQHAKTRQADQGVVDALQHLPRQQYGGPDEVSRDIAEATGESEG